MIKAKRMGVGIHGVVPVLLPSSVRERAWRSTCSERASCVFL